jgi:hypothetical protein
MANTYTLIASNAVGAAGASSVTFSSIPQTYTDLKIVCSVRGTTPAAGEVIYISLNSSTSNFSAKYLQGDGASAVSGTIARFAGNFPGGLSVSNVWGNCEIYIPNYTSTNAKSYSVDTTTEDNTATAYATLIAGLWNPATQAAITQIDLTAAASSFLQYSNFYLYGIKNS